MSERIDPGEYLLGELSGAQLAEAERLLREDESFRAEVERLRPVVSRLEELPPQAWEELTPPALPPLPAADSRPAPSARRIGRLRPALASLGAAALLAVGVGIGWTLAGPEGEDGGAGRTVAFEPVSPADAPASGSAELVGAGGGEADLELSGLPPSAEGEYYELWLLTAPDDLISLGSFRVDESGAAEVQVPLPVDPARFEFLDISVERDDGDASHSGVSVLRAPT